MTTIASLRSLFTAAMIALATFAMAASVPAQAATSTKSTAKSAKKATAQKAYATPEELFQALADAAKTHDTKALSALLGPQGAKVIDSGDKVSDQQGRERFASAYAEKHSVVMNSDTKATLMTGKDDWPSPIPAVKGSKGWTLDTAAGARELLARRIGANELAAIQVVRAIGDAQRDYATEDRNANGLPDYARRIISTPGKKDGLYWKTSAGEPPSPLGDLIAKASGEGYSGKGGQPIPYHGYYYRILTEQGKDAKGGAMNYIVQGMMIGGFAVVAYPAQYGGSGVMSFIAGADGVVYEKDLGDDSAAKAKAMKTFNPDSSWKALPNN
jgi:hypothetical protein